MDSPSTNSAQLLHLGLLHLLLVDLLLLGHVLVDWLHHHGRLLAVLLRHEHYRLVADLVAVWHVVSVSRLRPSSISIDSHDVILDFRDKKCLILFEFFNSVCMCYKFNNYLYWLLFIHNL